MALFLAGFSPSQLATIGVAVGTDPAICLSVKLESSPLPLVITTISATSSAILFPIISLSRFNHASISFSCSGGKPCVNLFFGNVSTDVTEKVSWRKSELAPGFHSLDRYLVDWNWNCSPPSPQWQCQVKCLLDCELAVDGELEHPIDRERHLNLACPVCSCVESG
ncbi:hypothetical protein MRX96_043193 [Rhipicephalus microplus]